MVVSEERGQVDFMTYEMLFGLNVLDDVRYQEYRKVMKPIL